MKISEQQLKIWSSQGTCPLSKKTHEWIEKIITTGVISFHQKYEMFLQGSYKNDTNIYAESDVDSVIIHKDCFLFDISLLTNQDKHLFLSSMPMQILQGLNYQTSSGRNSAFKIILHSQKNIIKCLSNNFPKENIRIGNKAVTILPDRHGSRRKLDLLITVPYRLYSSPLNYEEGVCFYNRKDNKLNINFPKQHSKYLTEKNKRSNGLLKPIIRICKNSHKYLIDNNLLQKGIASSYDIECMIYNVPTGYFKTNYQETIINCFDYLQNTDKSNFVCPNQQLYLFRNETSWSKSKCKYFIDRLTKFFLQKSIY